MKKTDLEVLRILMLSDGPSIISSFVEVLLGHYYCNVDLFWEDMTNQTLATQMLIAEGILCRKEGIGFLYSRGAPGRIGLREADVQAVTRKIIVPEQHNVEARTQILLT